MILGSRWVHIEGSAESAELIAWWDASDETTITESGGDVSQIDDKTGNGYHFTQSLGSSQPITGVRTINSLNVLNFKNDYMENPTSDWGQAFTIACVAEFDQTSGDGLFSCRKTFGTNFGMALDRGASTARMFTADGVDNFIATQTFQATTPVIFIGTFDGSNASIYTSGIGTQTIPANITIDYTGCTTTLGSQFGNQGVFDGGLGECRIYNSALTGNALSALKSELGTKWNIAV
jgi:hypothetical protein